MIHWREPYDPEAAVRWRWQGNDTLRPDEHPRLDGSAFLPGIFLLLLWALLAFWP